MGLGMFGMFDLNGDGELNGAEMALAHEVIFGDDEEVDDDYGFDEDDEDDDY